MTSGELLRYIVNGVFVMTFKQMGEWGVATDDAGDFVLTDWPSAIYFKRRCGMECAIDERVHNRVICLAEVALAGQIGKFPCRTTARKISTVIHDLSGQDVSLLEYGASESPNEWARKAEALVRCLDALLLCALDRPNAIIGDAVSDIARTMSEYLEQHEDESVLIADETVRYANLFSQPLHLEDPETSPLRLADVFVRPRFQFVYGHDRRSQPKDGIFEVVDRFAHGKEMDDGGRRSTHRVLTVLGQPGVGKTSLIAGLLDAHAKGSVFNGLGKVACVRLSRLAHTRFYSSRSPLRFIICHLGLAFEDFENGLLILDGLDELCLVLSAGATINDFYSGLLDDALSFPSLRVIVTSRLNYIGHSLLMKGPSTVMELLPFDLGQAHEMVNHMQVDGRRIPSSILKSMYARFDDFPFLGVPLLLYTTLALELDLGEAMEVGDFYDRIFSEMSKRTYGDGRAQTYSEVCDPREIAGAFAVEMRRRSDKCLDERAARAVLASLELNELSEELREAIGKGFGLTFFYTGSPELDGHLLAPEFAHRSFVDFLAAEQIYARLCEAIGKSERDGDGSGLTYWWEQFDYLLGWSEMGREVLDFFVYKARNGGIPKSDVANTLLKWFTGAYLTHGMAYRSGRETNENCLTKVLTLFTNYWRVLKSLCPDRPLLKEVDVFDRETFFDMLRVASTKTSQTLCFDNEDFEASDLGDMILEEYSFRGADFSGANMTDAHCDSSDFTGARFVGTLLTGTDFENAMLSGADMRCVSCEGIHLSGAMADSEDPITILGRDKQVFSSFPDIHYIIDDAGAEQDLFDAPQGVFSKIDRGDSVVTLSRADDDMDDW